MSKKDIKKIIIPAIAIIVIIGGLVVYFVKPQEVQPVMAPLETEQDLVEEKEEIPEEPQEDTVTDNNEVEIATETEEAEEPTDNSINSTHTDITLGEDEYKGDDGATTTNDYGLTEEEQAMLEEMEQEVMQKHPEWFTDTNPNKGTGNQGNWDNVGTPDNTANTPQIQFGQGDYSELGSDVTVY